MRSTKIIRFNRRVTKPASRNLAGPVLLLMLFGLAGCQAAPPVPYDVLTARIAAGEATSPGELDRSFRAAPDHVERLERLAELELQAYAILEDEPLKLGSLGTAMLDNYYGSLTGHYVLARFYRHLENAEAAELHEGWVEQIRAHIKAGARLPDAGADGKRRPTKARQRAAAERTAAADGASRPTHLTLPYLPAATAVEAQVYALTEGLTPVGSIYQTSGTVPLALLLQGKPESGRIVALQFDLTGVYEGIRSSLGASADDPDFNAFAAVGYLAREGDSAAQTAVGAFLASQERFEDAVNWLRAASRTGNLIANTLLARIFWEQARATEDEEERENLLSETLDNYLQAITLGSSDAMYALGVLYLNGHFEEENVAAGVPLLRQAADLENDDALIYLGHLHYTGEGVEQDYSAAREFFAEAAALGNPLARRTYARFLLDRAADQASDPRAAEWLRELADGNDAEAMLLLGNLAARGQDGKPDRRAARRWYRKAVSAAPLEPALVNEIAWTLAVSTDIDLREPTYARAIMDTLMNGNAEARKRPEYLDTWAAAHAASGDFERARALQAEAVAIAEDDEFAEVRPILAEHLALFERGETVSEAVP